MNWTVESILNWTSGHFASKNIESSRIDAELLLAETLKCRRIDLYLKFDQPLKEDELSNLREKVKRRAQYEPVSYILGEKEFYGRDFKVGKGVLIPRPETEHLVDKVLELKDKSEKLDILDVGCGSGCLGITLALEFLESKVDCLEFSSEALLFVRENIQKHSLAERVSVLEADFSQFETDKLYDVVVSNPPYVGKQTRGDLAPDVAEFEPHEALFGGDKGHETIESWLPLFFKLTKPQGLVLFEMGFDQEEEVSKLLSSMDVVQEFEILRDYSGHPRIAYCRKKNG